MIYILLGSFENSYIPENPKTPPISYIFQTVIPLKKPTSEPSKTGFETKQKTVHICTKKKSLHICKSFFRKKNFATGLIFERFLAPRSRFFEKVNGLGVLGNKNLLDIAISEIHSKQNVNARNQTHKLDQIGSHSSDKTKLQNWSLCYTENCDFGPKIFSLAPGPKFSFCCALATNAQFGTSTAFKAVRDPEPLIDPPIPPCEDKTYIEPEGGPEGRGTPGGGVILLQTANFRRGGPFCTHLLLKPGILHNERSLFFEIDV
ncbi:hypothetical protein LXL04_039121 [Taraxacum kok-saghyz]